MDLRHVQKGSSTDKKKLVRRPLKLMNPLHSVFLHKSQLVAMFNLVTINDPFCT